MKTALYFATFAAATFVTVDHLKSQPNNHSNGDSGLELVRPTSPTSTNGSRPSFAPAIQKNAQTVVSIIVSDAPPQKVVNHGSGQFSSDKLPGGYLGGNQDGGRFKKRGGYQEKMQPEEPSEPQPTGQGSGVIISHNGYILTNNHVIENAGLIKVTLPETRTTYTATLVGSDPKTDLAVLKIEAENLTAATIGDSSTLAVGDWVLAIGSPFGLNQSVTAGVVSAMARSELSLTDYGSFIQTDAPINPGNSGGPLIDIDGNVIGINTAIFTNNGSGNLGIGFSIPINQAITIAQQIVDSGEVRRGYLGVSIGDVDAEAARQLDLPSTTGALVHDVTANSPAADAGIEVNDVITSVDGQPIRSHGELRYTLSSMKPGTTVEFVLIRDGKELTLQVDLGEQDETPVKSFKKKQQPELREQPQEKQQQQSPRKRFPYVN